MAVVSQPAAFLTVTVNNVVALITGEILCVVSPVLQTYEVPPLAVKVTASPLQTSVTPVIVATGLGVTVTVTLAAALSQPEALLAITE